MVAVSRSCRDPRPPVVSRSVHRLRFGSCSGHVLGIAPVVSWSVSWSYPGEGIGRVSVSVPVVS